MSSCKKSHPSCVLEIVFIFLLVGSYCFGTSESRNVRLFHRDESLDYQAINCRKHSALLTDFGAVGDGKTLNTKAFQSAIANLSQYASDGGAELVVPPGKWLTGSFNLTSHFTLYLRKGAVLLASQNEKDWPLIDPLPSYGLDKDFPKGRYASLIFGANLTDVVITGNNGTINGQGAPWWDKFKNDKLKATRPFLIEMMYTNQLQISNITLVNSPFWNIHPVYSSNILVQGVTILAPVSVPNTDGINPDSCANVRIQDVYIVSGDDCIALKSGWDEYGIKVGMPTEHVVIRRLTCISPKSATIALGSEMSGGLQDIRAEDITAINTESAIRIKTAPGRGGFIRDIYVRRMTMKTMKYVFWVSGAYKTHPDNNYNKSALAEIKNINYMDMVAENVTVPGSLRGFSNDPFTGFCISNVTVTLSKKAEDPLWKCSDIKGVSSNVTPKPCNLLPQQSTACNFPTDKLPIESVKLNSCTLKKTFM